jgi:hypothetical protein
MFTDPQAQPSPSPPQPTKSKATPVWMVVLGWIVSLLPAAVLCASGVFKLTMRPGDSLGQLGWFASSMPGLAIIELGGAALFLFPRTAVLGAVLLTGYLGGAIASHVRIGEPFLAPIIIASLLWLGLVLRDARLRLLLPWRGPATSAPGGFLAALGRASWSWRPWCSSSPPWSTPRRRSIASAARPPSTRPPPRCLPS